MAAPTTKPAPVVLRGKVRKALVAEGTLDVHGFAEDLMGLDDPKGLVPAFERVEEQVEWVRVLMGGVLSDSGSVSAAKKLLEVKQERVAQSIGEATIRTGDPSQIRKKVRQRVKEAKRLRAAWLECRRFQQESMEISRDEAARRDLRRRCEG